MKPKNPIFFYLFLFFVILNLLDIITAFFILPGEGNPIFILTGSIWPVMLMKLGILYGIWFYYKRNKYLNHMMYYFFISILVMGSLLMSLGITSNVIGIFNPQLIDEAAIISPEEKIATYSFFATVLYVIPMVLNFLIFFLYDKSMKHASFDKQYYKDKKWWRF